MSDLAQLMLLDPRDALKGRVLRSLAAILNRPQEDLCYFVVAAPADQEDAVRAKLTA